MADDYQALQKALAAEHAVIWAYGEVGAAVGPDLIAAVTAADQRHRERRHDIEQLLIAKAQEPVAGKPAYSLPSPITDQAAAIEVAAQLEDAMCAQWRYCLGRFDSPDLRQTFSGYLTEAAVAAYQWRRLTSGVAAATVAFPGA